MTFARYNVRSVCNVGIYRSPRRSVVALGILRTADTPGVPHTHSRTYDSERDTRQQIDDVSVDTVSNFIHPPILCAMALLLPSLSVAWGQKEAPPTPSGWTLEMQPGPVFIAAFPFVLGLIFMINARTEIVDIMVPGSIPKGNKDVSYFQGVMVHYFFILGIAIHAMGVVNLAICLGFPPTLAFLPAFTTLTAMALFMAIFRTGIAGAPKFSFPPIPGVIGLPTITGVLAYQAFNAWESYGLTDLEKMVFAALVLGPIVLQIFLG